MVQAQYHRSICVLTVNHGSYFAGLAPSLAQGYTRYHKILRKKMPFFWPSWTASLLKLFPSLHTIIFWRTWTVETTNLISQITTSTECSTNSKSEISKKKWHQIITHVCLMYHHVSCITHWPTSHISSTLPRKAKSDLLKSASEGVKADRERLSFVAVEFSHFRDWKLESDWKSSYLWVSQFPGESLGLKIRYPYSQWPHWKKSDPLLGITAAEKTSERRLPCCSTFSSTICCFTADLKRTCHGHSSLQEAQERFWIHDLAAWILRTKRNAKKCCVYSQEKKGPPAKGVPSFQGHRRKLRHQNPSFQLSPAGLMPSLLKITRTQIPVTQHFMWFNRFTRHSGVSNICHH